MSDSLPSLSEDALCRCKALYLGTAIFNNDSKKFNESRLSLSQLQESISLRYPVDGSNYSKGIQTCLSVYPSGIQMEHSSSKNNMAISALFFYPIKSLVYCGALRFIKQYHNNDDLKNSKSWKFVPLDSELAQMDKNLKNPPLFVAFVKGIDPSSKRQIIECHVFVVGMVKTAMTLVESCQKAFGKSATTVNDFYKKYGNVPVVFCMKDDLSSRNDSRVVVKNFDLNGYYYATDQTPIDVWQLFEECDMESNNLIEKYETLEAKKSNKSKKLTNLKSNTQQLYTDLISNNNKYASLPPESSMANRIVDPYEKTENLVKVEKKIDPNTGQNIYVRYLSMDNNKKHMQQSDIYKTHCDESNNYDLHELIYSNHYDQDEEVSEALKRQEYPPIIIRQEKTPSPIIVEKYVKKKSPQVIIKEIHVHEPAPPPIKVVEKMDGSQTQTVFSNETKKFMPIYSDCQNATNSGSNIQIHNTIIRPNNLGASMSAHQQLQQQQACNRFRNMVCHTTYETLRGEPVQVQATPAFFPRNTNPIPGNGYSINSNCHNYSNSISKRHQLKDINYYLNRSNHQNRRNTAPVNNSQYHNRRQQQPYHNEVNGGGNNGNNGQSRNAKNEMHMNDRRNTHINSQNRDNYREPKHYRDDNYAIDENNYNSNPKSKYPNESYPNGKQTNSLPRDQPKSILAKKPINTRKGEMSNRYYRGFIAEEYGYY